MLSSLQRFLQHPPPQFTPLLFFPVLRTVRQALSAAAAVLEYVTRSANDAIHKARDVAAPQANADKPQDEATAQADAIKTRKAAIIVQKFWRRGCVERNRPRHKEIFQAQAETFAAAVLTQLLPRWVVVHRVLRSCVKAATQVQAFVRGRRVREKCVCRSSAAIKIQVAARTALAVARVERMREGQQERLAAVMAIQALWRGVTARTFLSQRTTAAVVVQM